MGDASFRINRGVLLNSQAVAPSTPVSGTIYYDSALNSFVFYNNGKWVNLASAASIASTTTLTSTQFTAAAVQSSLIRLTGSTSSNLYGMTAQTDGRQLILYTGSAALTIYNNNATEGTAANRIVTYDGSNLSISAGTTVMFVYDAVLARWILTYVASLSPSGAATLSNKNLIDASVYFVDQSDSSKVLKFDVQGTASKTTTIIDAKTDNRSITLPDATTTLLGHDTAQVVTNKDLDGGTASNTSRLTIPKSDKTTLNGLTRKEGTLLWASDLDKLYIDDGTNLKEVVITDIVQVLTNKDYDGGTAGISAQGWLSTGGLNTARHGPGGAGTQVAGLSFGGATYSNTPYATTEKFNGSAWSAANDMTAASHIPAGCGSQSAAMACAWIASPNGTQLFNGTTWSNSGNMTTSYNQRAACGTQSAALACGGNTTNTTEKFNGSTWTIANAMNNARRLHGSFGTQSAGVGCGGWGPLASTETFDGTSWTNSGNLNTARTQIACGGTQTAGFAAGGYTGSVSAVTEIFNGANWSVVNSLITARTLLGGAGDTNAGLSFGGNNGSIVLSNTELYGVIGYRRFTVPQNTKTTLDGLVRKEGSLYWANDQDKLYVDDGTGLKEIGYTDPYDTTYLTKVRSGLDANGIYTVVTYKRADNTRIVESTLSGGTSPQYTTRTVKFYDTDGTTELVGSRKTFTLAYALDEWVSETLT